MRSLPKNMNILLDEEQTPLAYLGFFEKFGADERAAVIAAAKMIDLPAGEILFQTGEPGGTFYVIESGTIELFVKDNAGQRIVLKACGAGDFFGEISLFDSRARSATATAATDCRLFELQRAELLAVFAEKPETALLIISRLGESLREADKLLRTRVARNANEMMEEKISLLERAADWMAWFSGSLHFLGLTAVWFVVWIAVNTLPLGVPVFDPFPFGLLTMITSLEAIFLSCFVLISQNRQAAKDHVRSDIEYDVNIKAEMEIAHLHEKTDRLNEQMLERLARIESLLAKNSI